MEIEGPLIGLPDGADVSGLLTRLRMRVESLGVKIVDNFEAPSRHRSVGFFNGPIITLYPLVVPPFVCWFTIAHFYGHMTQLVNKTPRVELANALVLRIGESFTPDEIQVIYDHEREAAEIGRALVADVEPALPLEMDVAFSRLFHADFRYFINAIETAECSAYAFARYWRREPVPRELIMPDTRPLLDMGQMTLPLERVIVI